MRHYPTSTVYANYVDEYLWDRARVCLLVGIDVEWAELPVDITLSNETLSDVYCVC